ncbi:hypothetical protein RJZ56_002636 [Blastomyces dermatitidis]|uniref:Uncharacterized protein n=1 Tax=Ajellomyces dermatitidis (strain ER-3 / ATCC MYA-2586) TaxID=559297 RepID=A0ABM9YH20_AJEDR|nr:uncharacterized protein BDCG_03095 [Blastomyces dermatitidis ER-3]EEQ87975.1 hypothetical protein BDCG_03095 [Blastomyces dermatitidis ER-3]
MLLLSSLILSFLFARKGAGLQVTEGSPCESTCRRTSTNTTDAVVCLDHQYNSPPGTYFEECVKCELRSTYFRSRSFETHDTDVNWGLYNLRYALSTCVFDFPVEKPDSMSSPCRVTCDQLGEAIKFHLLSPTPENMLDFCGMGVFDDGVITQCAACYNLTETEKYLGNFVEAIREGCHANLPNGVPFMLDPNKVFDTEPLPANTNIPQITDGETDKKNMKNLILVIVLPIIGFLLLLACACGACIFCVHRRRRKAKRKNQPTYLHERWNDTGIMSPVRNHLRRSWGEPSPYQPEFTGPCADYPNQAYPNTAAEAPQDVKYPPETYAMESTSQQYATVSPKSDMSTPKLFPPPPPRKSMND